MHSALMLRFGRSIAFVLGAGASMLTGYTGMWLAVRANVRVAEERNGAGVYEAVITELAERR